MNQRKKIQIILMVLLGFIFFIPNANCVSDTVYLEKWDVTDDYYLEASEGDLIAWQFTTYDNPFIVYFRAREWSRIISHDKTSNNGVLEVLESGTFRFIFENIGDTGGGYLEFEIKILDIISGFNLILILGMISVISVISVISIIRLKKMRVKVSV